MIFNGNGSPYYNSGQHYYDDGKHRPYCICSRCEEKKKEEKKNEDKKRIRKQ